MPAVIGSATSPNRPSTNAASATKPWVTVVTPSPTPTNEAA